jgi:hypothetical protein
MQGFNLYCYIRLFSQRSGAIFAFSSPSISRAVRFAIFRSDAATELPRLFRAADF